MFSQEIFFASINKFKSNGDLKANELLDGNIKRVSAKGGFDRLGVLNPIRVQRHVTLWHFIKIKT